MFFGQAAKRHFLDIVVGLTNGILGDEIWMSYCKMVIQKTALLYEQYKRSKSIDTIL